MESKNVMIICAWAFLIMLWILSFFGEWDLLWPLILSFIILIFTVSVSYTDDTKSNDTKGSEDIQDLKSKLNAIEKDIKDIKKIIEE